MVMINPWVVVYPATGREDGFIAEDLWRKKRFLLAYPEQLHAMHLSAHPQSFGDLVSSIVSSTDLTVNESCDLVSELQAVDILVNQESLAVNRNGSYEVWRKYGWRDALDFYASIYDYPFLDYQDPDSSGMDDKLMAKYVASEPVPAIFKDYPGKRVINLVRNIRALDGVDFERILAGEFPDTHNQHDPIAFESLSSLLFFAFGATGTISFDPQGEFLLKTSPSGGARHPIEAYLICKNVEQLSPGLYHYSVRRHGLEVLQEQVLTESLEQAIHELRTGPQFSVKAVIVFTGSIHSRSLIPTAARAKAGRAA